MTLACVTHGHAGCVGAEQDDCEIVTIASRDDDRDALAYFAAAQLLARPSQALPPLVPLLPERELVELVERVRGIANDLRETAGETGAELWRAAQ